MELVKRFSIGVAIVLMSFSVTGCKTTAYDNWKPEPIKVEPMAKYDPEFMHDESKLDPPVYIYAKVENGKFTTVNENDPSATHLILSQQEYGKVSKLLTKYSGTKQLLKDQVDIVNSKIDLVNDYQARVVVERRLTNAYNQMWHESEQAFKKERRDHQIDKIIDKGLWCVTVIGGIAAFSLL